MPKSHPKASEVPFWTGPVSSVHPPLLDRAPKAHKHGIFGVRVFRMGFAGEIFGQSRWNDARPKRASGTKIPGPRGLTLQKR